MQLWGRRTSSLVVGAAMIAALLVVPVSAASAGTPPVERIAGDDRYATSARISAATFGTGVATAYVASGTDFPDALAGAAAAGSRSAPVLLTLPSSLPGVIASELTRLAPRQIIVLGGEAAVSAAVSDELAAYTSGPVTRISGANRYDTSASVSAQTFPAGVEVAYLASGYDFPDALSAASVAGAQGAPILLTGAVLPEAVRLELVRLRPNRLVVLGGPGAVADSVVAAAAEAARVAATRLAGSDRYGTSAAISASAFGPSAPVVYIASGLTFADALSGAAAARGAPVLLTTPNSIPQSIARELIRLRPARIVVLGGEAAVSAATGGLLALAGSDFLPAAGGRVTRDTEVRAGSCLASVDSTHQLCVGADGRIAIRRAATTLWTSGTTDASVRSLRIRTDGNAVLYSVDGRVIWESGTAGTAATELRMQNDGDAMLATAGGAIVWSSMTSATAPRWRLPFAYGQRWAAGAPHANSGTGARGSLDFGPVAGGDRRVLSIAPGTVYRIQCGTGSYLGINHAGGWQSTYYHLVNYQNQLVGQVVPAGTYLGDVGRTVPCGGGATFDHVHLTIRRAGSPVSVEGNAFGGYIARSSGRDYWGFWTSSTGERILTAPGGAACCLTAQ